MRLAALCCTMPACVWAFNSPPLAHRAHRRRPLLAARDEPPKSSAGEEDPYERLIGQPGLQDRGPRVLRRGDKTKTVPLDQQPFNELQNLKEAPLFGWAQLDLKAFATRLAAVYGIGIFISYPIARVTFPNDDQMLDAVLSANVGALALVTVLVLRLYVGWSYIGGRLDSEVVEYEESGWYDGSSWVKPPEVRARDQMLCAYEVKPVLQRCQAALGIVAAALLLTFVGFKVVSPGDPYEQYSQTYLEGLRSDDAKAAEAAKAAAGGKPTYCGARFYRALANAANCD